MFRKSLLLLVLSLWSAASFANVAHHSKPQPHRHIRHHRSTTSLVGVKGHALTTHVRPVFYAVRRPRFQLHNEVTVRSSEECLASAIYWESKSEPADGQAAVGYVVTNRTGNHSFPKTVCGVVYQRGVDKSGATHCQFSWSCGSPGRINTQQMEYARLMARSVLNRTVSNPIGDALYFHEARLALVPSRHAPYRKVLGGHAFYSPKPYELASR